MLNVLLWPIVACVLLPWLFVYLGLHVVQRRGAFVLAIIVCVVAAITAALLLTGSLQTSDEMRRWILGDVASLRGSQVLGCFAAFVVVGLIHYWRRRSLLLVAFDRERARERGLRVAAWDSFFYITLIVAIAICVRDAGVLLLVGYLLAPALAAVMLTRRIASRLLVGWIIAVAGGIAGLCVAFYAHFVASIAIVAALIALLALFAVVRMLRWQNPERLVN